MVKKLNLNLTGFTIITEVGSGYFIYTPIIAAVAGAKRVYAWTKDTPYGKGKDIINECEGILSELALKNIVKYSNNKRPVSQIKEADIITNLGHVRPLNEDLLKFVKKKCVIPIMCEAWETRNSDIDVEYCKSKKIMIAGTWENHPDLKIFNGCGPLAVKMALEEGFEVYQNNIFVWSGDHFGDVISASFKKFGAGKVILSNKLSDLYLYAKELDFIFFCDYKEKREIIGNNGFIDMLKIKKLNPELGIIHLYGKIDSEYLRRHKFIVYPNKPGFASIMTKTLAHLGPTPIIKLHAAGLKVGELLLKEKPSKLIQHIY